MSRLLFQSQVEISFGFFILAAAIVNPAAFKEQIGRVITGLHLLTIIATGGLGVRVHQAEVLISLRAGKFARAFEVIECFAPLVLFATRRGSPSVGLGVFPLLLDRLRAVVFGSFEFETFEMHVSAKRKTFGKPLRRDVDDGTIETVQRRGVVGLFDVVHCALDLQINFQRSNLFDRLSGDLSRKDIIGCFLFGGRWCLRLGKVLDDDDWRFFARRKWSNRGRPVSIGEVAVESTRSRINDTPITLITGNGKISEPSMAFWTLADHLFGSIWAADRKIPLQVKNSTNGQIGVMERRVDHIIILAVNEVKFLLNHHRDGTQNAA